MASQGRKTLEELRADRKEMAASYPAFDEIAAFSLERRHLDVPEFADILVDSSDEIGKNSLQDHLQHNVRLLKIDEISFHSEEKIHLAGVENAITSMRGRGFSLLFIVKGDVLKTSIYLGLVKHEENTTEINSALDGYAAAWQANFPGTIVEKLSTNAIADISYDLATYNDFGVLTGIPSLKRKEESQQFVQGLERLIRAMRGRIYCWISIADPISQEQIREAIDSCQRLKSDIHHLVHTDLSKAVSKGKTVMLGMFGMLGQGSSESTGVTDSVTNTEGTSSSVTDTTGSTMTSGSSHSTSEGSSNTVGGHAGLFFFGGNASHSWNKSTTDTISQSKSILESTSVTKGTMASIAQGWANTVSNAISHQLGGGFFSAFGMTWNKTTTVGQELLNRKAEYVEEMLDTYEKRLHEGTALGMWNLGHYFCAADQTSYDHGIGVVTSLFSGMDSTFEPPRAIKMPSSFKGILRRFCNLTLQFSNKPLTSDILKKDRSSLVNHPLGIIFNGPSTPVNTQELAIATPVPTQEVEGISVSRRTPFALNVSQDRKKTDSLTVGKILDMGNSINERYRLSLSNLPKHLAVFGLTGSGKTNTVHNLLVQLWKNYNIPFLVIEPAKAEYRALANLEELENDLLILSAGIDQTSVCPLRLNPFDFEPGSDTDANRVHVLTHIDRLKATFNASFPMYASMPYILEEAILEVYRERGWDLGRSINRYVDIYHEDFRDYIPTLHDLYLKVDSIVQKKGYFQEQQMNIQAALKARLSSLMVGAKGSMLNCRRSIPSEDLFNRPVVIELENLGDDDEKAFLMGLLVSKLYEYRKAVFQGNRERPFNHVLVIEEAHRLLTNIPETAAGMETANVKGKAVTAFVDMLSEIRAMGQSVFIVDQLPSRVSSNIVKGTGSKIVHRLLAKDDRESVGGTMGLNDNQINDLCLLRTGECVVSQDGDRKAYMCQVHKNELHESREGGEVSKATLTFKEEYRPLFETVSGEIDMEDGRFRENLHLAMLAIGIGQEPETLLPKIVPTCKMRGQWDNQNDWYSVYWSHICTEIWSYYSGSYEKLLRLKESGSQLLQGNADNLEEYRQAFADYFQESREIFASRSGNLAGIAYEQFFVRKQFIEKMNQNFDHCPQTLSPVERFGKAFLRTLSLLSPASAMLSRDVINQITEEIVMRISPELDLSLVLRSIR